MNTQWRIGIDCRLAGTRHAGIGRYTSNLVRELLRTSPDYITWVLFFSDQKQHDEVLVKFNKNCEVVFAPVRHYSLREQLRMPAIFKAAHLDLLHIPHFNVPFFYNFPTVVTIHDLLWHEQRGSAVTTLSPLMYWLKYAFYHLVVEHAVFMAKAIYVPAETIKQTVSRYYSIAKNKTIVTYEGVAPLFLTARKNVRSIDETNYRLVYTGSLYPHKNIEVVLQLLTQHANVHLTLVGSRTVFRDTIEQRTRELDIASQVTFAGFLTDKKLIELYQQSDVLIQPSLSEGFGLTGLEALAVGLPAIVSDIPIFREIYGDAALYFDPHQSEQLWQSLQQLKLQRPTLLSRAAAQLDRYSWQKMASLTLLNYESVLRQHTTT